MTSTGTPLFPRLLRQHRTAAGLTQEELAERAGLSVRAVGDLERGVRHSPQQHTVRQLADALGLSGGERSAFFSAVHPSGEDSPVVVATPSLADVSETPGTSRIPVELEVQEVRAVDRGGEPTPNRSRWGGGSFRRRLILGFPVLAVVLVGLLLLRETGLQKGTDPALSASADGAFALRRRQRA